MNRSTLLLSSVAVVIAAALGLLLTSEPSTEVEGGSRGGEAEIASARPRPADLASTERRDRGIQPAVDAPRAATATRREAEVVAAPASGEGSGTFLLGRVVGPEGRGVPEARVRFSNGANITGPNAVRVLGAMASQSKSGVTDMNGSYRIEDPGLERVTVTISAPGYEPLETDDVVVPAGPGDRVMDDLVLTPGAILEGWVTDDGGTSVVGAEIRVVDPDDGSIAFGLDSVGDADAVTDERGAFRIDTLTVGPWALAVTADGYPSRVFKGGAERPGVQPVLDLEIPRGVSISGFAIDVPDSELDGLQASAVPAETMQYMSMAGGVSTTADIDSDGTFSIEGLDPAKRYKVQLSRPGTGMFAIVGGGAARSEEVEVDAGAAGVELVFRPSASVAFQVVETGSGRPVENFTARLGLAISGQTLNGADGEPLTFHLEGRAVFEGLFPEDYAIFGQSELRLSIDAEGYAPTTVGIESLEEGEARDLGEIEVRLAPMVSVLVLDAESGKPIKKAKVELRPIVDESEFNGASGFFQAMELSNQRRRAKTEADGRAELPSLPGTLCKLTVERSGMAPFSREDVLVEDGPMEYVVELGDGGEVTVYVTDERGERLGGVAVKHRGPGDDEPRATRKSSSSRGARFRSLEPGDHSFRLQSEGETDGRRWRRRRNSDGEDEDWVTVRVDHGSEGEVTLVVESTSRAFGRVRQLGQPLAGASVTASRLSDDAEEREQQIETLQSGSWIRGDSESGDADADGYWSIDGLEPGQYALRIRHESREMPAIETFELLGAEVRVDVDLRTTVVRGRILDTNGQPVSGVEVSAVGAFQGLSEWETDYSTLDAMGVDVVDLGGAEEIAEGATGPDGTFELQGLSVGVPLKIRTKAPGIVPAASELFTLEEEDEVLDGVEIVVEPAGAIVVTVVWPESEGRSWRFSRVRAKQVLEPGEEESSQSTRNKSSWGGRVVTMEGLTPGRWELRATANGADDVDLESESLTVDVAAGERREVELILR